MKGEAPSKDPHGFRKYDILFILIGFLGTGVFFHLTLMLLAGDWDFWTDWKDRQWWPLLAPTVTLFVASVAQYLAWAQLRIPSGATVRPSSVSILTAPSLDPSATYWRSSSPNSSEAG